MHPCAASYLLAGVVILHATIGTGLRQVFDASPHIIVFISDCCCCSSARCSSTPRGLDDVLTASAVCFLALGFWLPIRHALIERHYFPSPPHFFSAVASSFSHTLATVPHRAGLPYFQTLARLPDVRAFSSRSRDISHFTVTLNHPPVARYLALHRRRSEWSTKAQFPISIAAYHLGTQPSLALRTHLCSDDRNSPISISRTPPSLAHNSEHYTIQASLAVTLRRYTHPPHARMRLIGGKTECLTRTAFSSVVAACRCSHESFLSFPARTLRSAPSWRWPPPWRTSPAASCAASACSSRPPPVPSAPRVGHGATTAAQHDAGLVRHGA